MNYREVCTLIKMAKDNQFKPDPPPFEGIDDTFINSIQDISNEDLLSSPMKYKEIDSHKEIDSLLRDIERREMTDYNGLQSYLTRQDDFRPAPVQNQEQENWRNKVRSKIKSIKNHIPQKYREDPSSILDQDADTIWNQIESSDVVNNIKRGVNRQNQRQLQVLKGVFRKVWGK